MRVRLMPWVRAGFSEQKRCGFRPPRISALLGLLLSGCTLIGPDFEKPDTQINPAWRDLEDTRITSQSTDAKTWWKAFKDPILDGLIEKAYAQNLTLRAAGLRVLQGQAQLGVSIGQFWPQEQKLDGLVWDIHLPKSGLSERLPSTDGSGSVTGLWLDRIGPTLSWELDIWGKLRRAIESADASLLASVAAYDNVLVTLTADVAVAYIRSRTIEKKIEIAHNNVHVQLESLRIAEAKFRGGSSSRRDVEQAKTVLGSTQAKIPMLEAELRRVKNALSVLLGMAPNDLEKPLGAGKQVAAIPVPPVQVAVGIPLDLLRRRPDVRQAENYAHAQAAQVGVAKANLYPAFSISGSFAFVSSNASGHSLSDIFAWGNQFYRFGPAFQWNVLNYGQITNQVRGQDARYQEALVDYQQTVLKAQKEVEDGLIFFLKGQDSAEFLAQSTAAAKRSLELATVQYREGIADFTTVLTAEQSLLTQQEDFATTLGEVASSLVLVYRGMGGGWQIREGKSFIPPEIQSAMENRTGWGSLLDIVPDGKGPAKGTVRAPQW